MFTWRCDLLPCQRQKIQHHNITLLINETLVVIRMFHENEVDEFLFKKVKILKR